MNFVKHVFKIVLPNFKVCSIDFDNDEERIVPRFYTESRLVFCVSSDLDPIGDRNDV